MSSHRSENKQVWAKDKRGKGVVFHNLTTDNPHAVMFEAKRMTDTEIIQKLVELQKQV